MSEVLHLGKDKIIDYPEQQELYDRLLAITHEYDNDISIAAAVGVFELVKDTLINEVR